MRVMSFKIESSNNVLQLQLDALEFDLHFQMTTSRNRFPRLELSLIDWSRIHEFVRS